LKIEILKTKKIRKEKRNNKNKRKNEKEKLPDLVGPGPHPN
jgi:hypothetical protein